MENEFKVKEVAFEEQKSVQEIEEQLPKEVGPSITVVGAGTDWGTVMKGSVVAKM